MSSETHPTAETYDLDTMSVVEVSDKIFSPLHSYTGREPMLGSNIRVGSSYAGSPTLRAWAGAGKKPVAYGLTISTNALHMLLRNAGARLGEHVVTEAFPADVNQAIEGCIKDPERAICKLSDPDLEIAVKFTIDGKEEIIKLKNVTLPVENHKGYVHLAYAMVALGMAGAPGKNIRVNETPFITQELNLTNELPVAILLAQEAIEAQLAAKGKADPRKILRESHMDIDRTKLKLIMADTKDLLAIYERCLALPKTTAHKDAFKAVIDTLRACGVTPAEKPSCPDNYYVAPLLLTIAETLTYYDTQAFTEQPEFRPMLNTLLTSIEQNPDKPQLLLKRPDVAAFLSRAAKSADEILDCQGLKPLVEILTRTAQRTAGPEPAGR